MRRPALSPRWRTPRWRPAAWPSFISEMPPSESSCIRKLGFEGAVFQVLAPKVPHLAGVNFFERIGASSQFLAISLKRGAPAGEAASALQAASAMVKQGLKWIVAVDDDIDITDIDSVLWAMPGGYSRTATSRSTAAAHRPGPLGGSGILIDATMKWPCPPVSLPNRVYVPGESTELGKLLAPRVWPRATGEAWIKHGIQEMGNFENFLPQLYEREADG